MSDLLIKNGSIIDGTGSPARKADITIRNGKIASIGPAATINVDKIIDASGLVVCPGFIDIHSHTDFTIAVNPKAESKIRQGVTTEIVGNCGMSAAPLTERFMPELKDRLFRDDYGKAEDIGNAWVTFGEYIRYLGQLPLGINLMPLIGFGTLRTAIMGLKSGSPTGDEIRQMEALLEQSFEEGAVGMSSGLEYLPDSFSHSDELIRLCKVVQRHDKLYASHVRGESQNLFSAIKEAIRTGEESGCRTQISHLKLGGEMNWGKTDQLFELLAGAISRGVNLTWDQYPYTAWGSSLGDYLPRWVMQGTLKKTLEYLTCQSTRQQIRGEISRAIKAGTHAYNTASWDNVQIVKVKSAECRSYEGRKVATIAEELGVDPLDFVFDLLIKERGAVPTLVFCMAEADIETIMQHPDTIVASDGRAVAIYGELSKGNPHPRYYGTFPRVLGHYVRGRNVLSLEMAVKKMTSMPARVMKLDGRGVLAANMIADITIFDPKTIADLATYEKPHQYSNGIEKVIIAGNLIIDQGTHSGKMVGQIIR
jgi:N-acyl-D-amino-acid deacylase